MGSSNMLTVVVIDAQSNNASPQGGDSRFGAAKKVTMGLLIALTVTAVSLQDKNAAAAIVAQA